MPLQNVQKYSSYLDSHLALVLLNRVLEHHSIKDLESFHISLLKKTRLVTELEKHSKVIDMALIQDSKSQLQKFEAEFSEVKKQYLDAQQGSESSVVDAAALESIIGLSQQAYQLGRYRDAYDLIQFSLAKINQKSDLVEPEGKLNLLWGRVSALICATASNSSLIEDLDSKLAESVLELRDALESDTTLDQQKKLVQRVWLAHWLPFLLGHGPKSLDASWQVFSHSAYLNAVQTTRPYLLRYYVAVTIMKLPSLDVDVRQSRLNDLIKVLAMEQTQYSEALSELLLAIFSEYNFDKVPALFSSCKQLIDSDYFLVECKHDLIAGLEQVILRTFAKIYSEQDLQDFAQRLPVQHAVSKNDLSSAVNLSLVRTMQALKDLQAKTETLTARVGH